MRDRSPHRGLRLLLFPNSVWFFNVPQNLYIQGLWDGAYVLSSLSEKTRKAALSPQLFKNPECWSGQDLKPEASRLADQRLSNRANRMAVLNLPVV